VDGIDKRRPGSRRHHHWLPERYRDWLDGLAHGWWRRGMLARLRRDHRLSGGGREETLLADIETRTEGLMRRYWHDVRGDVSWVDDARRDAGAGAGVAAPEVSEAAAARDKSHVLSACRLLATHQALSPWMPDGAALLGEREAGFFSSFLFFLVLVFGRVL
jgi:hypothetical protein